ncbi:hypothetical protein D3C73_1341250 [compost metagenome]
MNAGNRLHQRAVTVFETFTVERFQTTNIRGTVLRQFNILTFSDIARHAQWPHTLVAQISGGIAMQITHKREHFLDVVARRSNKLQQRFGKIRCYPFMRQR